MGWGFSQGRVCCADCTGPLALRPPSLPVCGSSPPSHECVPQPTSRAGGHVWAVSPLPSLRRLPCSLGPRASGHPWTCEHHRSPTSRSGSGSRLRRCLAAYPALCFQSPAPPSPAPPSPAAPLPEPQMPGPWGGSHWTKDLLWPGSPEASVCQPPTTVSGGTSWELLEVGLCLCPRLCGWPPCCGDRGAWPVQAWFLQNKPSSYCCVPRTARRVEGGLGRPGVRFPMSARTCS